MCTFIYVTNGLSKNYVATTVGMKFTRFSTLAETVFFQKSSLFNSTFGIHRHWLILIALPNPPASFIKVKSLVVLVSARFCRRPRWTPKTQLNGCSPAVWFSFLCSTRFTRKQWLDQPGESCRLHSSIFGYVVFGQPLKPNQPAWYMLSMRWAFVCYHGKKKKRAFWIFLGLRWIETEETCQYFSDLTFDIH